jgi:mannose-1-phosphate guanylyltransferase
MTARVPDAAPELYAVIMAGGQGRRFWPRSRRRQPKQLLAIGTREPLLLETVSRLRPLIPAERVLICCGRELAPEVRKLLPEVPEKNLVLEPTGRDTAPAIGLALQHLRRRVGERERRTLVAVLPADHYIRKPGRFRAVLARAARAADRRGLILTIGIVPDFPSPAYGYIRPGEPVPGEKGVRRVRRFVEKPDPRAAKKYLQQGYLWNAGMFLFRLDTMTAAFRRHLPEAAAGLDRIGAAIGGPGEARVLARLFPRLPRISIDYGIMEKADNVAVVAGDFGWRDVGGWDALYRLLGGEGIKNISRGPAQLVNSAGCYVESEKLVALVGVENLVVIETPDAILVLKRDRETDLKKLTDLLDASGRREVL